VAVKKLKISASDLYILTNGFSGCAKFHNSFRAAADAAMSARIHIGISDSKPTKERVRGRRHMLTAPVIDVHETPQKVSNSIFLWLLASELLNKSLGFARALKLKNPELRGSGNRQNSCVCRGCLFPFLLFRHSRNDSRRD
jgi:hypothetical protein